MYLAYLQPVCLLFSVLMDWQFQGIRAHLDPRPRPLLDALFLAGLSRKATHQT